MGEDPVLVGLGQRVTALYPPKKEQEKGEKATGGKWKKKKISKTYFFYPNLHQLHDFLIQPERLVVGNSLGLVCLFVWYPQ